jgi:methanogenic corrinoid protein MtbC1
MVAVGSAWENNTLEIHHEHFASACLSDLLREVREPFDHQARGPRVVAATFPGDAHESGLLMACVLMACRGYRVVYLGANTPMEQMAAAAKSGHIEIVAVSVSRGPSRRRASEDIGLLRQLLPRGVHLWVGGAGAPPPLDGVERFDSLESLDARLIGPS